MCVLCVCVCVVGLQYWHIQMGVRGKLGLPMIGPRAHNKRDSEEKTRITAAAHYQGKQQKTQSGGEQMGRGKNAGDTFLKSAKLRA